MAELADAADSKSAEAYHLVGVRPPLPAPRNIYCKMSFAAPGSGLSRKEPPRRAAARKSVLASVIPLTSGAVPQRCRGCPIRTASVSYTHLRAHETDSYLV